MDAGLSLLYALLAAGHVLSGLVWAGSTFALAWRPAFATDDLTKQQLVAAVGTVLAGLGLWGLLHHAFAAPEMVLGIGALCAIAAAGVQSAIGRPAMRRMAQADEANRAVLRTRFAGAQRIAAMLLAITVVCMLSFRYV